MGWKWAIGGTAGLFAAGVAVGYVANKRGIPQDDVPRWLVKGVTRRVLRAVDAIRERLPDTDGEPLAETTEETP